jgi:hypothetical protein
MKEHLCCIRTVNCPDVTFDSSLLLIVYHRKSTFINLDIVRRKNPSSEKIIKRLKQLTTLGEPVSHGRRTNTHPQV